MATAALNDIDGLRSWYQAGLGCEALSSFRSRMNHRFSGATIVPKKTVVVAGRTLQSLERVRSDLAPHIQRDEDILVVYSLLPGSDYSSGALEWRDRTGTELVAWEEVDKLSPDLVISSSPRAELLSLGCPLLTLPHGAGHSRVRDGLTGPAGIAPEQHRGADGRITTRLALPGPAALEQLEVYFPEGVPNAEVTGDICNERLRRSMQLMPRYRSHFGVGTDQRLIVVSTTHGPNSLAANHLGFIRGLLDELPSTFRVAVVAHPNIRYDDGVSVETLLSDQRANGLIMTEPEEWRDLVIAADVVLTDYGSGGFYAAAIGKAVAMLPGLGTDEMLPGSPLLSYGESVPVFDPDGDLEVQLLDLIARFERGPLPFDFAHVLAEPSFSPAQRLTDIVYELIGLESKAKASIRLIPSGKELAGGGRTGAWSVLWAPEEAGGEPKAYPATSWWKDGAHRVAEEHCPNADLMGTADVIRCHGQVRTEPEAVALVSSMRRGNPLVKNVSVLIGSDLAYIDLFGGQRIKVRGDRRVLDWIASALCLMLMKLAAKALRFDIAEALVYLKRVFKVPLTLVAA